MRAPPAATSRTPTTRPTPCAIPPSTPSGCGAVREAAGDGLVINARVDTFIAPFRAGTHDGRQGELVADALERANAYVEAGADCVYPILLWEAEPLRAFLAESPGPVNVLGLPSAPSIDELAEIGVARVTYGSSLQVQTMQAFGGLLESLRR